MTCAGMASVPKLSMGIDIELTHSSDAPHGSLLGAGRRGRQPSRVISRSASVGDCDWDAVLGTGDIDNRNTLNKCGFPSGFRDAKPPGKDQDRQRGSACISVYQQVFGVPGADDPGYHRQDDGLLKDG